MSILVHPTSKQLLDLTMSNLPQSLLITGPGGIGLYSIAEWMADGVLAASVRPQDGKENADSESGTISVEMIRQLYSQTRAKHTKRQVILIDDADRMSHGAQSAFLKLLEEPNEHIYFILTSHTPQKLLTTIRSRVQAVAVQPLTPEQSTRFISSLAIADPTKIAQLQFIAGGLPAELTRLVADEAYFTKRAKIISDARDFLQATPYAKLLIIQKYKASRPDALQLIESAMQILRRSISTKPQHSLIVQLERLLEVKEKVANNHNIPLQLTQFVL